MHARMGQHADEVFPRRGGVMNAMTATEMADPRFKGLDAWDDARILSELLAGQKRGLETVASATGQISKAAGLAATAFKAGGRLIYLGAGSPGLIALSDALEIPQTYGIARDRIVVLMAGGMAMTQELLGGPEDDAAAGAADIDATDVRPDDCVVGLSASGTTRYTVSGLRRARQLGAATVGIAGNPQTPLLNDADVAILLATGAEVISGSTRMAAGTAQKATLNMLSTLIGIKLGHVHDNLMVNVTADNAKLVGRATGIVARVAGVAPEAAAQAMDTAENQVKSAILIAAGARNLSEARECLVRSEGVVRKALILLDQR